MRRSLLFGLLFGLLLTCMSYGESYSSFAFGVFDPVQAPDSSSYTLSGVRWDVLYGRVQDSNGFSFGLVNMTEGTARGWNLGVVDMVCKDTYGWQCSAVFGYTKGNVYGVQGVGLSSVVLGRIEGLQSAVYDQCDDLSGIQFGVVNAATKATGLQFGVVNYSEDMRGVQVGLINIITRSPLKFCPILNVHF